MNKKIWTILCFIIIVFIAMNASSVFASPHKYLENEDPFDPQVFLCEVYLSMGIIGLGCPKIASVSLEFEELSSGRASFAERLKFPFFDWIISKLKQAFFIE